VSGKGCGRADRIALGLLQPCQHHGDLRGCCRIARLDQHGARRLGVADVDKQPDLADWKKLGQERRRLPAAPALGGGDPLAERRQPGGGLALAGQQPAAHQRDRRECCRLMRGQGCPFQVPTGSG
jgi:hypothetical protein